MRLIIIFLLFSYGLNSQCVKYKAPPPVPVSSGLVINVDLPAQTLLDTLINQTTNDYTFQSFNDHVYNPLFVSGEPDPIDGANTLLLEHPTSSQNRLTLNPNVDKSIELVFRLDPQAIGRNNIYTGFGTYQFTLINYASANSWFHRWRWDFAALRNVTSPTFNSNPEDWNHLVITYEASTRTLTYYHNNVFISSEIRPVTDPMNLQFNGIFDRGTAGSTIPFLGDIGIFRVYNTELTAAEVDNNFNYASSFYSF